MSDPSSEGHDSRPVVLRVENLAKAFGATQALRSASFELLAGEVHAIIGENGSGKSTLVKILSGLYRADRGSIEIGGVKSLGLRSPRAALEAGIVTVFQEVLVAGPRSVVDNVWLGTSSLFRNRIPQSVANARARDILAELLGTSPDLTTAVEELSLSDRQACCIARALVRKPRLLILDEATSALDVATRDRLFSIIRRLAGEGASVVFISHRMDEIEEIGDRITVLRGGETVGTVDRGSSSSADLIRLMTGADQPTAATGTRALRAAPERVLLRAHGLRLRPGAATFDFELRAGELVGVAGLEGHGQNAFLHALRGGERFEGRVEAEHEGRSVLVKSPAHAAAHGIAYVPRERRGEALFETRSVRENFALPTLGQDTRGGVWISDRRSERRLSAYVEALGITLARSGAPISTLSGGNQQKVVIGRWLASEPRILLLNDPTRGVDIGAKRDIYALLGDLTAQGMAIVMLSTEVDEHVELMDRVLVFRDHVVSTELPRTSLRRRTLVASFFGRPEDDSA